MTIGNLEVIDIGLPNESTGSDSLYLAFNKTKNNFAILANAASPYVSFVGNAGINVANTANTVYITNTGVTSIIAGTNVTINQSNGAVTISASAGGNGGGGTVSNVGVTSSTLSVNNSPITTVGNIVLDLPATGVVASQYTNPTVTVDTYGRITNIANNTISGTVTSVSITPGTGMQVTTSGNANVNPGFTLINTGVTRISQGSGIQVSSSNGNVTISTTPVAAVTSVSVASTSLTVTGSPITGSGTITIDLANTISITGNAVVGGIKTDNYYYANGVAISFAGSYGNSNVSSFLASYGSNTISTTGNITGGNLIGTHYGAGTGLTSIPGANVTGTVANATSAVTADTVTTAAQPNITSTGTLVSLSVSGNANIGNIGTAGLITSTGNVTGGNIVTAGIVSATGNIEGGNLVLTTGNIIYTPRYGSFYSNTTQTNPVANTAMAMTFNNTNSANGVSVTSNSRLTVAKAGVYNIQFSAQCTKTDAGTDYLEIWLSKNGNAVASTSTRLKLDGSNVYEIAAWNFVETLGAGEYVQVMWGSADLNAQLVAIPSANTTMGIDVPSVIVTVTPVGA